MDFLKSAVYQNHFADTTNHLDFALVIIPRLNCSHLFVIPALTVMICHSCAGDLFLIVFMIQKTRLAMSGSQIQVMVGSSLWMTYHRFISATYQTSCDLCSQCDNEPSRCLRSFPACDYDFEDNTCIERFTETNSPPCDPCSECNGEPLNCFQSYPVCVYDRKEEVCYERFTETNPLPCYPCSKCDDYPKDCLQSFPHCYYDGKNKACQEDWCDTEQTIMNDCNIDCLGHGPTLGPEFDSVEQLFTSVPNISGNGFVTNWNISSGPTGQAINLKCPKADPALDADVVCEKGRWVVPDSIKDVCGTQN